LAIETSEYYGLDIKEAKTIVTQLTSVVSEEWIKLARKYNVSRSELEYMNSAFCKKIQIL
jgi:hypothetical protein